MNPSYSPSNSSLANPSGGSTLNHAQPRQYSGRNKFSLSYRHLMTARYADVTPFYVSNCVSGDTIPLASTHELRTYTLKSPLMSTLRMNKTYAQVPMNAILPRTWDYIFDNPTSGDDAPLNANTVTYKIPELITNLSDTSSMIGSVEEALYLALLAESICSYGGLTHLLGCSFASRFTFSSNPIVGDCDTFFPIYFTRLLDGIDASSTPDTLILVSVNGKVLYQFDWSNRNDISIINRVLDIFRSYLGLAKMTWFGTSQSVTSSFDYSWSVRSMSPGDPFNYDRLIAYQLTYAEFFTNQFVDSVYSAALFRDNAQSIATKSLINFPSFTYNGVKIQYDAFSGAVFDTLVESLSYNLDKFAIQYFGLIFNFRNSLKFTDYFTGAKVQPLAVGNVIAPLTGQGVSAVDMTRNIQMQRFLNAVQKTGRKFSNYVKGIFGSIVPPDYHQPSFISSSSQYISGFEVENTTSEDQGNIVSLLKSNGGQYEFSVDIDIPSIIIGVFHFDVVRCYGDMIEKFFNHVDRFDMFNPYMQYIGDQPISQSEYHANNTAIEPFGYTAKYSEYKVRPSVASGAFCTGQLPSWAFVDTVRTQNQFAFNNQTILSSDFIRNANSELDRFYSSLSHIGLGNYFHFIVNVKNESEPIRQMDVNSNIL